MKCFVAEVEKVFVIGKATINPSIKLKGTVITEDKFGATRISLEIYLQSIYSIALIKHRFMEWAEALTDFKVKANRSLAGALIWLDCVKQQPELLMASRIKQNC